MNLYIYLYINESVQNTQERSYLVNKWLILGASHYTSKIKSIPFCFSEASNLCAVFQIVH